MVARSRAGSSPAPFTLECEAGLASLQLWSPTRTFLEQNLTDEEPGFAQDGKWLGGPRSGVCYGSFALAEERASRSGWACSPARARGSGAAPTYFFLLHEPHKGCPLDLHGLALSVVEGQDEVEEVGFPQIGRRLLLKVSPGQTHPAAAKDAELDG